MSIISMPTLNSIASKFENLRERANRRSGNAAKHQKQRRLLLDPLEERQLLSVSPADFTDILVNQTVSEDEIAFATAARYENNWDEPQSIAMDDDGDFVVTWTRYDQVTDPDTGQPVTDPVTGEIMRDANIYARYFTDEVQRIALPDSLVTDSSDDFGWFTVKYGGNEVQKLTISATYEPIQSGFSFGGQDYIAGNITLGFDVNGSGSIGPNEQTTIVYNELNTLASTATDIETALQGLGGALADVSVQPISPTEFEVHFGDLSGAENQPKISVENTDFNNGFLPAVQVETLREPVELGPIYVSPDDPYLTATAIEEVFRLTTTRYDIGPWEFPPPDRVRTNPREYQVPYDEPEIVREGVPSVSVVPVWETVYNPSSGESESRPSLTQFEITFDGSLGSAEGAAGKKDHPQLLFVNAEDEDGNPVDVATEGTVRTIKEPSPEFRVNPEEPENPFTPLPDKFNQTDSAVAMDADGDFVITWTSEIPESQDPRNIADIYARQFTPVGLETPDNLEFVPGIMAQGDAFRVNQITPGVQADPSVGMDDAGNFTIAWSTGGQDYSYFNSVFARDFDRDYGLVDVDARGDYSSDEYLVNSEDTSYHFDPYVALSYDGDVLVTWVQTDDERFFRDNSTVVNLRAKVYDSDGNIVFPEFSTGGAGRPKATFDKTENKNFIITWDQAGSDNDGNTTGSTVGVRAQMWELYDDSGVPSGSIIRPEFMVNSADFDTGRTSLWGYQQWYAHPGLDADGDLTIAYEGFGPDVSDDVRIDSTFYAEASADPANADLLPYFSGGFRLPSFEDFNLDDGYTIDVDLAIEMELIRIANAGATDEQLGRVRAILDEKAGLLRGDAYGIMYSQFDASPDQSLNLLFSDNIANAQRDGHNQRYILLIDADSTGGNFVVRLANQVTGPNFDDVTISPVYNNNVLNRGQTRGAIEEALRDSIETGDSYPYNAYEGPVAVRLVSGGFNLVNDPEIDLREVTLEDGITQPWSYTGPYDTTTLAGTAVYEITFQGESHDQWISMSLRNNNLNPDEENFLALYEYQEPETGTLQEGVSLEMEPDGDFTMVWMQWNEYTYQTDFGSIGSRGSANKNIYYRRFDEEIDDAGPRVTDLVDHAGNRVDNDGVDTFIEGPIRHLVVTFDEPLLTGDPEADPDSVLNPENWILTQGGVEVPNGIAKVEFGLNKASEVAGTYDGVGDTNGGQGEIYDLSAIPTGKWEAVITLDGNGGFVDGVPMLGNGEYDLTARAPTASESGIRDLAGNPLRAIGPTPSGSSMTQSFRVSVAQPDQGVDDGTPGSNRSSGTLHPESPNAVAVDADGDHVVVWTAYDDNLGHDRVYMRLYDSDGTPADLPVVDASGNVIAMRQDAAPVLPLTADADFADDIQRYASVSIDPDGDFVVTWTNYRGGDADIYARQFPARPIVVEIDPDTGLDVVTFTDDVNDAFKVNDYTQDHQKWSDVAMDKDGDFVITWTSANQELNGQLGSGYGVYARRYDSTGRPLAPESQVNVTTVGDQQTPSVAMAQDGNYVIVWTSDQNGTDDDIIARDFNADGSAVAGPLSGERLVNDIVAGNQRYPDVAMRFDGQAYIVTWTDSAADISGNSVWAELSAPQPRRYLDPFSHIIRDTHTFTIDVTDNFLISDIEVQLGLLVHQQLEDLQFILSHGGVQVTLFDDLPRSFLDGTQPDWDRMNMTIFDDQAPSGIRVTNSDLIAGAGIEDYQGTFVSQQVLQPFVGTQAQGIWTLTVIDRNPNNGRTGTLWTVSPDIGSWNLDLTSLDANPQSFQVNTTTEGHQMFPSVAMDYEGNFTVTWSGRGTQEFQTDPSGHGVFYQRYNRGGTRLSSETLVNLDTQGDQWISSIGMDATGNFVVAWAGEGTFADTSSVYKFDSVRNFPRFDNDGPIVTDVYSGSERVFDGGVITADSGEITQLTVAFSEDLSIDGGIAGLNSVLNPNNWSIVRNETEIVDGIRSVEFGLNPLTNKYEATLTFDGNGVNFGSPGLPQGEYILTVRDLITDVSVFFDPDNEDTDEATVGNALDGDFDGVPGSRPISIALGGYEHSFSIAASAQVGPEFRVNEDATVPYEQRFAAPGGIGQAREESNRNVAVDHDGDFAVVWTSYGQDDPADPTGTGVYLRLYDRENNPLTGEIQVNQNVTGEQRNTSIAMDADGDLVVVWESEGTSLDGSWDVFARRFDAMGRPLGDEFRVNTTVTDNQLNPTVAMDDRGAFVVAWATSGQDFSFFNDVYAQRYDRFGEAQGSEFRVNVNDLPGTSPLPPSRFEINPAAAMSGPGGEFVIAWEVVTAQAGGVVTDTVVAGRLFDGDGSPQTGEFQLDTNVGQGGNDQFRVARNPQLVMDDQAGFIVVWESYTGAGYDVFYQEFSAAGTATANAQVNLPLFAGHQVNPSVAIDADGDFAIVWNGSGAKPDPLDPTNPDLHVEFDDLGVFLLNYNALNQAVDTQERVNYTRPGNQSMPTIGMEPDGDAIVVWNGVGVGDNHGIFARRYDEPSDTAGPTVSDWADQRGLSLDDGHIFEGEGNEVQYFVLTFDEAMLETGPDSVTNPDNYALLSGGINVPGAVVRVEYGLNKASELTGQVDPLTGEVYTFDANPSNKYEAILTFDGDPTLSGIQPLPDSSYTLQALAAVPDFRSGLRDAVGNVLYRTGLTPTGQEFAASFIVQIEPAEQPPEPDPPQVEDRPVLPIDVAAVLVNQQYADVQYTTPGQSLAVDNDGDFVVAWTRYDGVDNDGNPTDANVYARYFTDELQRLSLPDSLAQDNDDVENTLGRFSLAYNAAEIQMLSITSGVMPFTTDEVGEDEVGRMSGSFVLGYDVTGDGTIGDDPGVNELATIRNFNEASMESNAATIQTALRNLGGELSGVTVRAINPRDYLIEFAEGTAGLDIPQIVVDSFQLAQSAYLPAVSMSTLREGMAFENIAVSQDNPMATAQAIENAFRAMSVTYDPIGPVDFPPPDRVATADTEAPYTAPWWSRSYAPEVEVTPVVNPDGTLSLTEFDITFSGTSGKQDHPELEVVNARNDQGQTVSVPSNAVTTRKQPSNEIRVNPGEPDDPATSGSDAYDQMNPSVAMDADGDFVIVWESEVPNSQSFGSTSDIFARRFAPYGIVDPGVTVPGEVIDVFGESSGIRTLINPEAEDVQRLIFDADDPFLPLTGTFRLKLGDVVTEPIAFDSQNLRDTADDIEAKLHDAGIEGVTVVQVATATTGRYRLEVRFGGASAGVDQPTLEYVADATPLSASVTATDMTVDLYTIDVNRVTANPQFEPTVAMDEIGNFVVAWANGGQRLSFFNHISVQRFNQDGERVGNEFQANTETTDIQFAPHVALSEAGNFIITWTTTPDPQYYLSQAFTGTVSAKLFDTTGNQLVGEFAVGGGGRSMAAFDSEDNYIITWQGLFDTDGGVANLGVHAREFQLFDDAGQANTTPVEIREEFRVNSASTDPTTATLWPYDQFGAQPAIDADGDLSIIYQGYGPDVSVNVTMAAGYFSSLMGQPENQDLLPFFDPFDIYDRGQEGVPVATITRLMENNGDVDGTIDQVLFRATELGASNSQLGRLRAILELTVGQLRGEANGILLSQWDADPTLSSVLQPLYSDSVVNSYRDGQNQRSYIEIPMQFSLTDSTWYQAEQGTFTVQVTNPLTGQVETAVVDISSNGMGVPLSIEGTRQNLEAALEGMTILGTAWPGTGEGPVDIREVTPDEITDRIGTDWELESVDPSLFAERAGGMRGVQGFRNVLYEIVFQGSAHDTPFEVEIINSATERGERVTDADGNFTDTFVAGPAVGPAFDGETYGLQGTVQSNASIGMEPDGDFVTLYTQVEAYQNSGFVDDDSGTANSNIYYRRFDEETDTAGPRVTDWSDGTGSTLEDNAILQTHLQYVVVTFDEELLSGDPSEVLDSVLNTENYRLLEGSAESPDGVIRVAFGLSKAAELAGQIDPLTGEAYDLNAIPSNKWEAVITLDGDPDTSGAQPLRDGFYTFEVLAAGSTGTGESGIRDKTGNTLYRTGYEPTGYDFVRSFSITSDDRNENPIDDGTGTSILENGHTHPESPGAIAADADGQYAVVWTATDPTQGNREKVFYRLFDADGSPADLPIVDSQTGEPIVGLDGQPLVFEDAYPILPITPSSNILPGFEEFSQDTQNHATIAMDADGDFVVSWTNYRDGDADVYARRFDSLGELAGVNQLGSPVFKGGTSNVAAVSDPFLVNGYTDNSQKWSNVAMDVDGDFIITWSSYGQEDNGQFGTGYGVYARRYDSFGTPLAGEFQINVTEAGDQQFSTVAMDSQGGFTIAWTSDQNGISDDIIVRDYNPDGTPVGGPLGGEVIANQTQAGDQRYPDIAMNLAGDQYVVTWTAFGQDGSGSGVYGRLFNRSSSTLFVPSSPDLAIPDTGSVDATLNVSNNAIITDVNVRLELQHASPVDLTAELISPSGTVVELFTGVPGLLANNSLPQGGDFSGTLFDDAATVAINDAINGAVPPFAGTYQPTGSLAAFNGENVNGQWRLRITDSNGNDRSGLLEQWTLVVERSPAVEQEFRVNTTSAGDQTYSSVAMDHQGEFVVTWSGFGNQADQEDFSGSGVFLQRFEATGNRIGEETRVNTTTEGDQGIASVTSDGIGNYYVAFTGVARDSLGNNIPGRTDVYVTASRSSLILQDNDPPIVTDVKLADGTRLLQGDVLDPATDSLIVVLSENMSQTGMDSIERVSNWALEHNGGELLGAIESVDFRWNAATRKYEAELTLAPSALPLSSGEYQVTLSSVVTDGVNSLDGDLDGIPGANPITTTQPGYQFRLNISNSATGDKVGAESRVNAVTHYEDRFSAPQGTGTARETSNTTLAVDHDGDYVVVWTRYGQDDPGDASGAGVYMRLFDRNDNPLTNEVQVNTFTEGHQRNASVAMDADGDFVVVWESMDGGSGNLNADHTYDIYARRFSAAGTPLDFSEYRVNTELTGHQVNPAVAMDDMGNFAVVWATAGQDFSFHNDVKGQMFRRIPDTDWNSATFNDFRVGTEFLANSFDVPGVGAINASGFEINPTVAMAGVGGDVVIAWEVVTTQQDGVVTDTEIAARLFSRSINGTVAAAGPEFAADTGVGTGGGDTLRVARNPQLAADDQGGFILVWESYTGADYDVFYQEFDSAGNAISNAQVNMAQFLGHQVNPSVGIDADGDFAIVFNGNGAQPDPLAPNNPALYADEDPEGIWVRRYDAANEPVSVQSRVNIVEGGIQQFPTIGMEPDGDRIVAWNGRGVGDQHGIFVRRYDETTDTAGPRATELRLPNGTLVDTDPLADPLAAQPNQLVVVFDEELRNLSKTDADSVENVDNWRLERSGVNISHRITNVEFGLGGSNKWEAVLTFDSPLLAGQYRLQVEPPVPDTAGTDTIEGNSGLRDVVGNPLGQDGLNPGGQTYALQFRLSPGGPGDTDQSVTQSVAAALNVSDGRTHFESPNSVAMDADGDTVVVLTAADDNQSSPSFGRDRVYYRRFDANGSPKGNLQPVTTASAFANDDQRLASVATDSDGDFVVTWTNYRGTDSDIYARRFHADGTPMGDAFLVNAYGTAGSGQESAQIWSDVAMDIDGDFIIAWSSDGQEQAENGSPASGYGVYARRYDSFGAPLTSEFRVNLSTAGEQRFPSVAMDAQGGYYVVWTSDGNGLGEDIIGRSFYPDGSPIPGGQGALREQTINTTRAGDQSYPDVAMNLAGDSVIVTWSSANQDGDGWGVFARNFDRNLDPTVSGQQPLLSETPKAGDTTLPLTLNDPFYNSLLGFRSTVPAVTTATLTVNDAVFIDDLNLGLTLTHPDPQDLEIYLTSPGGTRIQLVDRVPSAVPSWRPTLGVGANGFIGTIFDDEGDTSIADPQGTPPAVPPFTDIFVPEERLRAFDGELSVGTWTLEIVDNIGGDRADLNYPWVEHGAGQLEEWSLSITQNLGGPEFQVNSTSNGNQLYSSVVMDQNGDFVIAWSGRGDREFEEDEDGVFYRRYDSATTPLSGETLVNYVTEGRQWMPSIGSDGDGNFVITYTGEDSSPMNTDVYLFRSERHLSLLDDTSPLVTDVLLPAVDADGTPQSFQQRRLIDGDSIVTSQFSVDHLTILFSEQMALAGPDGRFHPGSVEKLSNWALSRNGTDLPLAVRDVEFTFNSQLQKYQAVVSLDGNGGIAGTPVLGTGEYVLTAWNTIHDGYIDPDIDPDADPNSDPYFGANPLTGNFDLGPGTSPGPTGSRPFTVGFQVIEDSTAPEDALIDFDGEVRVNTDEGAERFAEPLGTGQAKERAPRSVAIDDDGDLAVVWTSYLPPESPASTINNVANSSDVYLRLVDRNDSPITQEILVNEQTGIGNNVDRWRQGIQRNVAVAMDADGDLIVVWESQQYRDQNGNSIPGMEESLGYDVWARRFDSMGNPLDDRPFRVNREIGGDQHRPAVDMDDFGNSIVAWSSRNGDQFSYFTDLYAQRFDMKGRLMGTEFQVNELSLPGTSVLPGSAEGNPAVALHESGSFVVAWEQTAEQVSGVPRELFIVARGFDADAAPLTAEFRVDESGQSFVSDEWHDPQIGATGSDDIHRSARNPQISMDDAGNYIVVWESFHDNDVDNVAGVDSFGIYFREFLADHTEARPEDHQANLVITTTNPDFNVPDPNVNSDKYALDQVNPSIAVDADGDFTIVWNGNGATAHPIDPDNPSLVSEWDRDGVFAREFHAGIFDPNSPVSASDEVYATPQFRVNRTDTGIQQFPSVAMEPDGDYVVAWSGAGVGDRQGVYYSRYSTAGDTAGPLATELRTMSDNLIADGDNIFANPPQLKVIFNEAMSTTGGASGFHSVENPNNWALVDGRGSELVGAISQIDFGLNSQTNKWEAVLTFNPSTYPAGLQNGYYTLIARTELYDVAGNPLARTGLRPEGTGLTFIPPTSPTGGMGFTFRVHELTPGDPTSHDIDPIVNSTIVGDKIDPAVARNADGNYVVAWTETADVTIPDPADPNNTITVTQTDIYARMFNADDEPVLNRLGNSDAFLVNSLTTDEQITPDVAIDDDGNFVVVWSGSGTSVLGTIDQDGIFGQKFASNGDLIGGQFAVNTTSDGVQRDPAVAMSADGTFIVTWVSYEQGGIIARKFDIDGGATGEFRVNTSTGNSHQSPDVAIDNDGEFTVVWTASEQDNNSLGIFGQRFNASGSRIGSDFQVNQHRTDQQEMPRIAMDDNGNFVVAWQSFGQDAFGGYGIYARRYSDTGSVLGSEFRVNDFTTGYQFEPSVAMDSDGDFVITWSSFNQEGDEGELYGIFAKMYNADGSLFVVPGQSSPLGEFRVNAIVEDDQRNSDVSMDAEGHYAVVWEGTSTLLVDDPADTNVPPAQISVSQTDIYARFIDPPATLSDDGRVVDLVGTPDNDTFEFVAGANPESWIIKVNGEAFSAGATLDTINFDGMGGVDTVILTGTDADEVLVLRPGEATFSGSNFTVNVTDVEDVTGDGAGGVDYVELRDSVGNDSLVVRVGYSVMTGVGYTNAAVNFENVNAYGTAGGDDEVKMYDVAGQADTFTATPEYARMQGEGYNHRAKGFRFMHGYASDNNDHAYLHDSVSNDQLKYYEGYSKLWGSGFYIRTKYFTRIDVIADGGGTDRARFFDTPMVDKFVGTPTSSRLYSSQADYSVTAELFERVYAFANAGGNDRVRFFDSPDSKEIFLGLAHKAELYNDDFEIVTRKFEQVEATSTVGSGDIAKFRDTEGDDHLVADDTSAQMYANQGEMEMIYQAFAFDQVKTYRSTGNDTKDIADTVNYLFGDIDTWIDI